MDKTSLESENEIAIEKETLRNFNIFYNNKTPVQNDFTNKLAEQLPFYFGPCETAALKNDEEQLVNNLRLIWISIKELDKFPIKTFADFEFHHFLIAQLKTNHSTQVIDYLMKILFYGYFQSDDSSQILIENGILDLVFHLFMNGLPIKYLDFLFSIVSLGIKTDPVFRSHFFSSLFIDRIDFFLKEYHDNISIKSFYDNLPGEISKLLLTICDFLPSSEYIPPLLHFFPPIIHSRNNTYIKNAVYSIDSLIHAMPTIIKDDSFFINDILKPTIGLISEDYQYYTETVDAILWLVTGISISFRDIGIFIFDSCSFLRNLVRYLNLCKLPSDLVSFLKKLEEISRVVPETHSFFFLPEFYECIVRFASDDSIRVFYEANCIIINLLLEANDQSVIEQLMESKIGDHIEILLNSSDNFYTLEALCALDFLNSHNHPISEIEWLSESIDYIIDNQDSYSDDVIKRLEIIQNILSYN